MNKLISLVVVLLMHAQPASASTFFIDAARGNDGWSGRLADPSAGVVADGPWQSLARAARASLAAGDTVALRCGSVWSETLKLTASGTTALPIGVRPYPTPCVDAAPMIDGFARTSGAQWVRQGANQYALPLPFNLLSNPRFDLGLGRWQIWSPVSDARIAVLAGCGPDGSACLQLSSGTGTQPSVAYSATFPIRGGVAYRLRFDFKAGMGTVMHAYVRRAQAPFDAVGVSGTFVGNGAWQSVSIPFTGLSQLDNARLDFDLAAGGQSASLDNVAVERQVGVPQSALLGGVPMILAHHPNRGHNALEPNSPYLRAAADADAVANTSGGFGSSYVPVGSDFVLPPGAVLQAGTTIRIRTNAWLIDERKVVGQVANRLLLDRPTTYPLKVGWGYYLSGAAWMTDEPGEWFYDATASAAIVRTATDVAPVMPLALGTLDSCIDIAGVQNLIVEGLRLTGCRTGVRASAAVAVVLRSMQLADIGGNGIFAPGSRNLQVLGNRIERVGEHALLAMDAALGVATNMVVSDNTIVDSGVIRLSGRVVNAPVVALGAIVAGEYSSVLNNSINGAAYHGIRAFGTGLVKGNLVDAACLVLDDCAGIYAFGTGQGSRIESNVVRNIAGAMEGKPLGSTPQAQGIFLDDHVSGVTVIRNTIADAETGVFLHNAFGNTVQANILYGNRKHQLWMLEDSKSINPAGDVYGNVIVDNLFFPTSPSAAVGQQSLIKDTASFATFDRNRYSALISSRIVSEDWPTGSGSFQFPAWQRATTPTGAARLPDLNGSVVNPVGFASFRVLGGNMLRNGPMTVDGWTPWNDRLPLATLNVTPCDVQSCLAVTAGASVSLAASPPFSVIAGNWYRVSFDLRSLVAGQPVSVMVRRGGGGVNGYESLMGSAEMVTGQPALQRFSFAFKSSKTINAADALTRDIGARLYFDRIAPGNVITLANVEVVPVSAADATTQTRLFSNASAVATSVVCPDVASSSARCSQYRDFASGAGVLWPIYIAPKSSVVVYTRDTSLVDSDGDGIADEQDQCLATPAGSAVNASGCSR